MQRPTRPRECHSSELFMRDPPSIPSYVLGSNPIASVDELLHRKDQILASLKHHLHPSQQRMVDQANTTPSHPYVLVRLPEAPSLSPTLCLATPLSETISRIYGPFKVLRRIGKVAYELNLPESAMIHPIFDVSLLKLHKGETKALPPSHFLKKTHLFEFLNQTTSRLLGQRVITSVTGDTLKYLVA
ncbi:hypothetical protein Scep_007265 [Stephania cephalantha]|uniref:Tf2-1-like SH3-like domain-containing protein n=1 Tax=Stephania cephalantha TaxID=152367 RepID=A0AAP0PKX6_9MAGN